MDLFFSYSRRDVDIVRRLHQALVAAGHACWVDWNDIPPSSLWRNEIEEAVQQASACLFVLSPHWLDSEVCKCELEMAERHGKRLIAVVARDVRSKQTPDRIRALDWIFCRSDDVFEGAIARIESAITQDLDYVRAHTRLQLRAKSWVASGREDGRLLRGSELVEAEHWLDGAPGKQPPVSEAQHELIRQSRQRGDDLLAQDLGLASVTTRLGEPAKLPMAVLLAVESARARPTRGTVDTLYEALSLLGIERASFQVGTRPLDMRFCNGGMLRVFSSLQLDFWGPDSSTFDAAPPGTDLTPPSVYPSISRPTGDRVCIKYALPASDLEPYEGCMGIGAWRGSSLQLFGPRLEHASPISLAAISPDCRFVVVVCDHGVCIWAVENDEFRLHVEVTEKMTNDVTSMAFSPDGRYAVLSGIYGATVIELQTGTIKCTVVHYAKHGVAEVVAALSFTGTLVTAVDDEVRGWSLEHKGLDWVRLYHGSEVSAVAVSLQGDLIASGGTDGLVRVWDTNDRLEVCRMVHGPPVREIAFSLDCQYLASADDTGKVRVWTLWNGFRSAKQRQAFVTDAGNGLCPDGTVVAETHPRADQPCVLRKPGGRAAVAQFPGNGFEPVAVSPGGKLMAATGSSRYVGAGPVRVISIYEVETRREMHRYYAYSSINSIHFGWSTRFMAVVYVGEQIQIIDLQAPPDRGAGFVYGHNDSEFVVVAVYPDSSAAAQGLCYGDHIRIVDAIGEVTPQNIRRCSGDQIKVIVQPTEKNPDPRELMIDINFEHAKCIHDVYDAYSRGGGPAIILTDNLFGYRSADGKIVVVSLPDGVERLRREEDVVALAIDAAGDRVALGLAGGDIRIESLSDAMMPIVLPTEAEVSCLAFRRDGKTIAASIGSRLCAWEVESGAQLHDSMLAIRTAHVALTPDGRSVVAVGDQPIADQMRPVTTPDLLEVAERAVGRTLTDEEWNEAMPGKPRPQPRSNAPGK